MYLLGVRKDTNLDIEHGLAQSEPGCSASQENSPYQKPQHLPCLQKAAMGGQKFPTLKEMFLPNQQIF